MKSLESVISQKCRFRGRSGWREEDYFSLYQRSFYERDNVPLYISNYFSESKNIITLLEEMRALIVFLYSCILYDTRDDETRDIHFKIIFFEVHNEINFGDSIFTDGNIVYDAPIRDIECAITNIEDQGYYTTFTNAFRIVISLIRTDWESYFYSENNNENNKITTINNEKTYKNDLCVICKENIPNVLFCLCGHICICEECSKIKKLYACLVCKTDNNILRII